LLTTHYMEEADALCHRLAIVDHGRMIAIGAPGELKNSIPGGYLLRLKFASMPQGLLERLQSLRGVREVRALDSSGADVYSDRGGSLIAEVASVAASVGADLSDVHISEPSLENLFLHHTGRSLRD
jgi:ABC-2 type transport system ATP-binding protein